VLGPTVRRLQLDRAEGGGAFPGRQVAVFTGDGSLTMQVGDFLTAVQHDGRSRWWS
jgi:hypothetical protein